MNLLKERIGDMIGLMSKNRLHKTHCFYLNVSKQHGIAVMHSKNITLSQRIRKRVLKFGHKYTNTAFGVQLL